MFLKCGIFAKGHFLEKVTKEDQLNYNLKESVNAINNQINAIKLSALSRETFPGVWSLNPTQHSSA